MNDINKISNKTVVRILSIIGLYVLGIYLAYALRAQLAWIAMAFFLAVALNPAVESVKKFVPKRSRGLSTGLVFLLAVVIIFTVVYTLLPVFLSQTQSLIQNLPGIIQQFKESSNPIAQFLGSDNILGRYASTSRGELAGQASILGGSLVEITRSIFGSLVALLSILALTFFMLMEGPHWFELFFKYLPKDKRTELKDLLDQMYRVVTGYVTGRLFMGLAMAVTTFVILTFTGVPYALPLSLLAGLLDLIPMVGATTGGIIVTLAALSQSVSAAIIVAIFYVIYQQFENAVIQPLVDSKTVQLSPLSVFVSALIGISVGGLLGGLVAIPIGGSLQILIKRELRRWYSS